MGVRGTAFASDYDGTLCQSNWETGEEHFDPAVLDAIARYQQAGGLFGLSTGRPMHPMSECLHGIVDPDFYIVTTGAQVFDGDQNLLFERAFDLSVAKSIYEEYGLGDAGFLAITDKSFFSVGKDFSPRIRTVPSLDDVEGKLLGVSLEWHGDQEVARLARDSMNVRYADSIEGFQNLGSVDVVAKGCSKGAGVNVVRDALGLSCVVGIGDSYNDLTLLKEADVSYTFHSSPQEVRDVATYVVEDLAEALDHFMAL